jgi:hypothetical protein
LSVGGLINNDFASLVKKMFIRALMMKLRKHLDRFNARLFPITDKSKNVFGSHEFNESGIYWDRAFFER